MDDPWFPDFKEQARRTPGRRGRSTVAKAVVDRSTFAEATADRRSPRKGT